MQNYEEMAVLNQFLFRNIYKNIDADIAKTSELIMEWEPAFNEFEEELIAYLPLFNSFGWS